MNTAIRNFLMVFVAVLALSSCASQPKNQILLMPAPDVFDHGDWDPFTDRNPIKDIPYGGILYATDRKPAQEEDQYYLDDRGHVLRLGVVAADVVQDGFTEAGNLRGVLCGHVPQLIGVVCGVIQRARLGEGVEREDPTAVAGRDG